MEWFSTSPDMFWKLALTVAGLYVALIISTRLADIRSFSKMSGFDFAITVAIGSVIASVSVAPSPALVQGVWRWRFCLAHK